MRKIKLSFLVSLLLLSSGTIATAQEKREIAPIRCATDEAIAQSFREHPELKAEFERKSAVGQTAGRATETGRVSTLTSPVVIPVIVHVVLSNPGIITEEQIDYLLNRLNTDYSGLNSDSTNGTIFYPVRGHSLIRFTRARRTPAGTITNGIERRVGTVQIAGTTYQAIKHTAAGGLDPWDISQYYNLWVGDAGASGLLGIAPCIGVGNQTETTGSATGIDGICVDYRGFSNGCFSYAQFALGRTVVHEVGHNFGLYHTFTGCAAGADFAQPTPAGQTLPATLVGATADDTPGLATSTSGCPTGAVASGCAGSTTPPGKMYQDYMDYTDDPCYSMFTNNQVARMHYMLETYRSGYLTTQGAVPPASYPAVDAGLTMLVSPGGSEFNGTTCVITNYPAPNCPGSVVPRVSVTNFGSTTITSITATVTVNGTTSPVQTFAVNLITNRIATLAFPAQAFISGANTVTFTILTVNGGVDTYTSNNTLATTISTSQQNFPFAQDFVTTTFPPTNMTVFNPTGTNTWVRNANGNVTAGSAFINNYNNGGGQIDDIRTIPLTPPIGATATDSLIISFDLAHRPYSLTSATYADTLRVLVSTDCGATFTPVYSRWNTSVPSLATAAVLATSYTTPAATDWRRETIRLPGTYLTGGNIIVAFRNIAKLGNNTFLDNINVDPKIVVRRDLRTVSVNQLAAITCTTPAPSVTLQNIGKDTVTAFKLAYSIDGGTPVSTTISNVAFIPNASQTFNLGTITLSTGVVHIVRVYSYEPVSVSGTGDQNPSNDTLTRTIRVYGTQAAPLVEGFENATFPPTGWVLNNPDGLLTWQRDTAIARTGIASAYVNNFNYAANGTRDELYTPQLTYSGIDSVFLNFDVAAATYSYPGSTAIPLDTLEVLVTNDCGLNYTSIYKRWGNTLQTVNDPNSPQTVQFLPNNRNQWRNELINLSAYASRSPIEVVFRNTTNYENNIFIDNVNLSTKTLPAKLKEQGYLIYPVPFAANFYIQHYLTPTDLRGIAVYNSIGQRVWAREYSSTGATSLIQVDLSRYANDVYTVVLHYTNRTISQKVIKVN